MKKFLIGLIALSTSLSAIATQTITSAEGNSQENTQTKIKSLEISLGLTRTSMSQDNYDESVQSTGLNLNAGKTFQLGDNFTTTSSLAANYSLFDKDDIGEDVDNVKTYDIGLAQRLGYNIYLKSIVIRPFIEAGISIGTLESNSPETYYTYAATAKINYMRYYAGLGVQTTLSNGLAPYIKYNISKLDPSSTGTLEANGQKAEIAMDSVDLTSHTLSVGLSYRF